MSIQMNYESTFLEMLSKSYEVGSYIRTFGFAAPGDGGAAMYRVVNSAEAVATSLVINNTTFYYVNGKFYHAFLNTVMPAFELVPQNRKVYAEQFGVISNDVACAGSNTTMLGKAVEYAASKGLELNLVSQGTYYLSPGTITVPSNTFFEGNGATLQIYGESNGWISFFDSSSKVDNIKLRNVTLIGRKISGTEGYADQAIHIKASNISLCNVKIRNFEHAIHTYGETAVGAYLIPDIPNENWLINNCEIKDCIFGLMCSGINGITMKDSYISCFLDATDKAHCVYLSSNCSNVRITNSTLCNVSGDAIHKAYAVPDSNPVGDSSKNHFYTDLSINNADSALDIGIISENVMCDNVFATDVKIALQLSGADNCIVSNSHFEQTKTEGETLAFIAVDDACKCWLQNSYVYYIGLSRYTVDRVTGVKDTPRTYYKIMSENKKHRRCFIGTDFDTPNYSFKFTGCDIMCFPSGSDYYFEHAICHSDLSKTVKSNYSEYWDNCLWQYNLYGDLLRFKCTNDFSSGVVFRNSVLENLNANTKQPFRFHCGNDNCECYSNDDCKLEKLNKRFPSLQFENSIFKHAGAYDVSSWDHIVNTYYGADHDLTTQKVVNISNSYVSKCYKMTQDILGYIPELMRI